VSGVAGTIPVPAQRAVSEGWEGWPGRLPARGTCTISMSSFDARSGDRPSHPLVSDRSLRSYWTNF